MNDHLPPATVAYDALAPLTGAPLVLDDASRAFAIVTWSCLVEPGDAIAGRLIALLGHTQALAEIVSDNSSIVAERLALTRKQWSDALGRWRPRIDQGAVFECLRAARSAGASLLLPEDSAWPRALDDLDVHAPICLWVRGDAHALARTAPSVAIVGARASTGYGEHVATELSAELAGRGVTIVSGAAYGIDGAAHRAAVRAGGTTIALLAGGVDRSYPAGHTQLLRTIAESGAVVSEAPCGSAPTKWRFLQRNRLIAALADATVVVEAGWRSGSLNTAAHAVSLARPLGAVPGPVTSAASTGCHRLLREFDARCVTTADEVMELFGGGMTTLFDMPGAARTDTRTDDTTRVTDALSTRSWRDTDDVARRAGIAREEVSAVLGLLSLEGVAIRGEAGWRRVSSTSIPR